MLKHRYSIIVSNVGTVLDTDWLHEALKDFELLKTASIDGGGRVAGEDVVLFNNYENSIVKEYSGNLEYID